MEAPPAPAVEPLETDSYLRRKKVRDAPISYSRLLFGADVPREIILGKDPEIEAIPEDRHERINISYCLAAHRSPSNPGVPAMVDAD